MTKQPRGPKPGEKSMLLRLMGDRSDKLHDALMSSAVIRFLCSYPKLNSLASASFFGSLIRGLSATLKQKLGKTPRREIGTESLGKAEIGIFVPSSLRKSMKTRLSEAVEESIFLEKAVALLRSLLFVPMISYGVFLFAFGLSTTVIQAMLFFLQGQASSAALDLFTGLMLVLLSLPAMFKGYEPLYDCLKTSALGSLLLRSLFGIEGEPTERGGIGHANFVLFVIGMLCGCATWLLPPMEFILLLVTVLAAIGVLFVPEAGLILLLALFPFMGYLSHTSIVCGGALLYVGLCWLLKVALGKRSFSVDIGDAVVFALMLIVLIGAFAEGQASVESALLYLAMMTAYPITANLLRSKQWIRRASDGLILSSFTVAFIGLIGWIGEAPVRSVFGSPTVLGCYLTAVIPLTLARMSAAKTRNEKLGYLPILLVQCGCILASGARTAMLVCLIELVLFALLSTRRSLPIIVIVVLCLPIAACILPFFPDLFPSLSHPLAEGRPQAAAELLTLIGKAPLTGIGMSDHLLIRALPEDLLGIDSGLSSTYLRLAVQIGLPGLALFLLTMLVWYMAGFTLLRNDGANKREKCYTRGFLTTLTAMLVMGALCYLWSDYRLLMLFWSLAGLYRAVIKYSAGHEKRTSDGEIPAEDLQWVNLDLYFDSTGRQKGSELRSTASKKGGNEK